MVGVVADGGGRVSSIAGGAGAVASVVVAVGAGPLEDPGRGHAVAPGGEGLEPVVVAAQRGEVRGRGGAGLGSAFCFGVVVVLDRCGRRRSRGRVGCTTGTRRCGRGGRSARGSGRGSRTPVSESSAVRSMTGLMVTLVRESPHQDLIWSSRTRRWPSSMRPVGPKTVVLVRRAWRRSGRGATTSRAAGSPSWSSRAGLTLVEQVERGLGAGEVAEGLGAAYVERLGRSRAPSAARRRGPGRGRGRGRRRGRGRPRCAGCRRSGRRRR